MNGLDLLFLVWLIFLTGAVIQQANRLDEQRDVVRGIVTRMTELLKLIRSSLDVETMDVFEREDERPPIGKAW